MASIMLNFLLSFIFLWDGVGAGCIDYDGFSQSYYYKTSGCYYDDNSYSSSYSSTYYSSSISILGAVIGSIAGLIILVVLLVTVCCILRRRQASAGRVVHTTGNNLTVMTSNTGSGGYINTATYPQGTQTAYPQYTYPTQQAGSPGQYNTYLQTQAATLSEYTQNSYPRQQTAPFSGNQPPPPYTECHPQP
uniref:Uncharacterized protein LOC111110616 n=1 Tax=Crassostrea virginica TaxID=6565 RepID=A0A8B8BIW8_CRAVI|nr:uncharacterized protein LOC111110616 [Crassostrea virginica]